MTFPEFLILVLLAGAVHMVAQSDQYAADLYLSGYEREPRP